METVTGSYDPLFDSQETEMLFERELAKIVQVYQFNCIYVVTNHNSSHLMVYRETPTIKQPPLSKHLETVGRTNSL